MAQSRYSDRGSRGGARRTRTACSARASPAGSRWPGPPTTHSRTIGTTIRSATNDVGSSPKAPTSCCSSVGSAGRLDVAAVQGEQRHRPRRRRLQGAGGAQQEPPRVVAVAEPAAADLRQHRRRRRGRSSSDTHSCSSITGRAQPAGEPRQPPRVVQLHEVRRRPAVPSIAVTNTVRAFAVGTAVNVGPGADASQLVAADQVGGVQGVRVDRQQPPVVGPAAATTRPARPRARCRGPGTSAAGTSASPAAGGRRRRCRGRPA